MEITFMVVQKSNDFVPVTAVITFKDNVEWDKSMTQWAKESLAELYDCGKDEVCDVKDHAELEKLYAQR